MTFREKTRWTALIVDLVIWAWYFGRVAEALPDGPAREMDFLWLAAGATIATIVIHVAAIIVFALRQPGEAGNAAYTLLAIGLVNIVIGSYFGWSKFETVNAVLAVFVFAEMSRYALEIFAYRRMAA